MDVSPVIAVVVPVYNQPQRLREVVERCLAQSPCVWVVDDGSDEPVASLLTGLDVEVIRHEHNRGKGMALYSAAKCLCSRGFTHIGRGCSALSRGPAAIL